MACNLKKQNDTQGVHLTERTCSPYNPIIKQIVDDCLGLPIYPVSSIDAVIDEEGKTLRLLLEELSALASGGGDEIWNKIELIENTINLINTTIEGLDDTFLTANSQTIKDLLTGLSLLEESLNGIKALVYKVTSMNATESNADLLYTDNVPTIVYEINNLIGKVSGIIGNSEGLSLPGLKDLIDALSALLYDIANVDNSSHENDTNLSFSEDNTGSKIQIVYEIKQLLANLLSILDQIGETPEEFPEDLDTHTIYAWLEELSSKLNNLIDPSYEGTRYSAHILKEVRDLAPSNASSTNIKNIYSVLDAKEYPADIIDFISDGVSNWPLKYYGNLSNVPVEASHYDFYPFGYVSEGSTGGKPLVYFDGNEEIYLTDSLGRQLYAGNGNIDGSDLIFTLRVIKDLTPEFLTTPANNNLPENLRYSNLYIKVRDELIPVGDYTSLDKEVNIADINYILDRCLAGSNASILIPQGNLNYDNIAQRTIVYWDATNNFALYPCIKGKLYLDRLTKNLFYFSGTKMIPAILKTLPETVSFTSLDNEDGIPVINLVTTEIKIGDTTITKVENADTGELTTYEASTIHLAAASGIEIYEDDDSETGQLTRYVSVNMDCGDGITFEQNQGNTIKIKQNVLYGPGLKCEPSEDNLSTQVTVSANLEPGPGVALLTDSNTNKIEVRQKHSTFVMVTNLNGQSQEFFEAEDAPEYFAQEDPIKIYNHFKGLLMQNGVTVVDYGLSINAISNLIDFLLVSTKNRSSFILLLKQLKLIMDNIEPVLESDESSEEQKGIATALLNAISNKIYGIPYLDSIGVEQTNVSFEEFLQGLILTTGSSSRDPLEIYPMDARMYCLVGTTQPVEVHTVRAAQELLVAQYDTNSDGNVSISDISVIIDTLINHEVEPAAQVDIKLTRLFTYKGWHNAEDENDTSRPILEAVDLQDLKGIPILEVLSLEWWSSKGDSIEKINNTITMSIDTLNGEKCLCLCENGIPICLIAAKELFEPDDPQEILP